MANSELQIDVERYALTHSPSPFLLSFARMPRPEGGDEWRGEISEALAKEG